MHDNPYESPLPTQPLDRPTRPSFRRMILFAILVSGLPFPMLGVVGAINMYSGYSEIGNLNQYVVDASRLLVECFRLGALAAFLGVVAAMVIAKLDQLISRRRINAQVE